MNIVATKPKFKPVPGFPDLYAGDNGKLFCARRNAFLPTRAIGTGKNKTKFYEYVSIKSRSGNKSKLVHQLVLLAHRGPCPKGMECDHEDDDGLNNKLENLRYLTVYENRSRSAIGDGNGRSKITNDRASYIYHQQFDIPEGKRSARATELANENNVHYAQIYRIWNGTSFKNIHKE